MSSLSLREYSLPMDEDAASRQSSRARDPADPGKRRHWPGGWSKLTGAEAPDSSMFHCVIEFSKQQLQQHTLDESRSIDNTPKYTQYGHNE